MAKQAYYQTQTVPRILIVGVDAPYNRTSSIESYFLEFENLVKSNNIVPDEKLFIKIRSVDSSYFFTKGKLQEVRDACVRYDIEQVILSEQLTPRQERNLSDFLECPVSDRTQLILEIFEKGAHSAEGKAQVAIALLHHLKTRLCGKGIHMNQQPGALGVRGGPGETAKEIESRHIENEILKIKRELKVIEQARSTQRKRRLDSNVPHLCLIGYTNAGKSTILNGLTKSNVLAADRLFATLDTTTRELYINHKKKGVLSDTVGFIQQLPHHLIEAFKSTLSELHYAHLLIQVVDISDENWQSHIQVVNEILADLDVNKEMVYVFNKMDKVANQEEIEHLVNKYQPHVIISANTVDGLNKLREFLAAWNNNDVEVDTEESQE